MMEGNGQAVSLRWMGWWVLMGALLLPARGAAQSSGGAVWEEQRTLEDAVQVESLGQALQVAGTPAPSAAQKKRPLATVTSPTNQQSFQVSLLTESEALALFLELRKDPSIPFGFVFEGAHARAHAAVRQLENMGIIAGKAWVEGDLHTTSREFGGDIRHEFNVAPMILVGSQQVNHPWVLDPAFAERPVPFDDWKTLVAGGGKSKVTSTYFTPRFHYGPREKHLSKSAYAAGDIQDAQEINEIYIERLQIAREIKKTKQP